MFEKYVSAAKELGAVHAVEFTRNDIVYDPRTILKCLFGCEDYGKIHTCPNLRSPLSTADYKRLLREYKGGIIIGHGDKNKSQDVSLEIEKTCFLDGFYFAFSLSDCAVCETCAIADGKGCRCPVKARPAFHSVGIDVFKTVRRFGLPLAVLQSESEEPNWYSAVFID